ncbi:MAG: hypothetical protein J6Y37_06575 [Paludibacteraceae bacterium]|nr:hypothetical protein [Paludibacteraceae bacterium]
MDQKNIDTPNLDFSLGEYGWTYQTGWYTAKLKGSPNDYVYIWDKQSHGETRSIARADISGILNNKTYAFPAEDLSRFWRYDSPQAKDKKFSFIPLSVIPQENRAAVMRIGCPDIWSSPGNSAMKYKMHVTFGGDATVNSDGDSLYVPLIDFDSRSTGECFSTGAEAYAIGNYERAAEVWQNPYFQGSSACPWAGAERMYYDFKVTENTTLLIYRFLAILNSPESAMNHSENGHPEMVVNILVKDETGEWNPIPCSEHHVMASIDPELNYPGVQPMFPNIPYSEGKNVTLFKTEGYGVGENTGVYISETCNAASSHAGSHTVATNTTGTLNSNCFLNYATLHSYSAKSVFTARYHYSGWRTRFADLRNYIGKTVRVEILNHDCLMNDSHSATVIAGGHSSYGYFQAETRKLEIEAPFCYREEVNEGDFVELKAPLGFPLIPGTYNWKRPSGQPIEVDPDRPYLAYVQRSSIVEGERVTCTINTDSTDTRGCSSLVLETSLETINAVPSFEKGRGSGNLVYFHNTSEVVSGKDSITSCRWTFPDGVCFDEPDVAYAWENTADTIVKLTVFTSGGCSFTKEFPVYLPSSEYTSLLESESVDGFDNLRVVLGKRMLIVEAMVKIPLVVRALNGGVVASKQLDAGERMMMELPAGVYLLNDKKILIK